MSTVSHSQNNAGVIDFRTANSEEIGVKLSARMQYDSQKLMMLTKWGLQEDLPKNSGLGIQFARYHNIDTGLNPIFGSTNPHSVKLKSTTFTTTLYRYGGVIDIPEEMELLHEDDLRKIGFHQLSYDFARKIETLTYNIVKSGSNVINADGAINRASIDSIATLDDFEAAVSTLEENNAREITSLVTSSPSYETLPIQSTYIGYSHTNTANFIRKMDGFISVEHYAGQTSTLPGEIGTVAGKIRMVCSNIAMPYSAVGGNPTTNGVRGMGGKAHIYPILIFANEAFACSKLAGSGGLRILVKPPSPNGDSYDKLGLNGHIGYKTWYNATILNNDNLIRIETAVPAFNSGSQNAPAPVF